MSRLATLFWVLIMALNVTVILFSDITLYQTTIMLLLSVLVIHSTPEGESS